MSRFVTQRVLQGIGTIIVVSIVVFLSVQVSGNPAALLLPDEASPEDIARLEAELGLDRPLFIQYLLFMKDFWSSSGTLRSFIYVVPLLPLLLESLKWTLVLAVGATGVALVLGLPLGALTALKRGSAIDVVVRVLAAIGQSLPSFWVAMLMMLLFAVKLQWFPVSGLGWKHAVLPLFTLALYQVATLLRIFRSEMLEQLHQDYVRTARAKGIIERKVVMRHVVKNAALPVLTITGLQLNNLVLGAVVVEPIFAWPGLGNLMVRSVFARDYPVVVGGTILAAVLITAINVGVDILYCQLDPRIRVQ